MPPETEKELGMPEDMTSKIAEMLKGMGYKDVRVDTGIVHYTEIDGTEHRLVEDVKDERGKWCSQNVKKYIVTRTDVSYCPVCEMFDTEAEAVEFVKKDFEKLGFKWNERYSMTDSEGSFPLRESVDGTHEWDIHEKGGAK